MLLFRVLIGCSDFIAYKKYFFVIGQSRLYFIFGSRTGAFAHVCKKSPCINYQTDFLFGRNWVHRRCDQRADEPMAQQEMGIILTLFAVSFMFPIITSQQCNGDSYSIYRKMLKGHTFKTFKARPRSIDCIEACNADDICQSLNYVMLNGICELNNRTKEARPKDFVEDVDRYYMLKSPRGTFFTSLWA